MTDTLKEIHKRLEAILRLEDYREARYNLIALRDEVEEMIRKAEFHGEYKDGPCMNNIALPFRVGNPR